jgi:hypothetical protein
MKQLMLTFQVVILSLNVSNNVTISPQLIHCTRHSICDTFFILENNCVNRREASPLQMRQNTKREFKIAKETIQYHITKQYFYERVLTGTVTPQFQASFQNEPRKEAQ